MKAIFLSFGHNQQISSCTKAQTKINIFIVYKAHCATSKAHTNNNPDLMKRTVSFKWTRGAMWELEFLT